ncbi:hypothetical protein ALNOE001_17110 [Candidatus Methanobinarius endosymbioticus]|uniref:Undecaprenyldiphospho-muramoylpentapeptide beta-N-acetylglucosaminyltransferase n=1 Tax=Candidatus Methanobinarius endosymbioticus TaxID=2006182 RepID=A0A366MA99_9EURY|nr:hypothetical protein ALNOE001_17110 [Candidatus Methanobinarius endosymbioticus]
MKEITIAIACELAPSKTIIPVVKKLKVLEKEKGLNWDKSKLIGLTHGKGAEELIKPYCDEIYSIGKGRGAGKIKRNNAELAYLILKDIIKTISALKGKGIDLLITCGNAGDVRKSITAANILRIPIIHIEQDIYNPIETIAYSNLITVPSKKYKEYLIDNYLIKSLKNIQGYPMASYVHEYIKNESLKDKNEIISQYGFSKYILLVLGGDLKNNDLPQLIKEIEKIDYPILIAPYRFTKELILDIVNSEKIKVLDEFVDLLSLMKSADLMIYGAGMGMTIESGVLNVPSIKIAGFHDQHGSVDLANELNIPIAEIKDISNLSNKILKINNENNNIDDNINDMINDDIQLEKLSGEKLVKNSEIAIEKLVEIINNFDIEKPPKKSRVNSMKAIWKERKKFR